MFNVASFNSFQFNSTANISIRILATKRNQDMQIIKASESVASRRRITFELVSSTDYITTSVGLTFSGSEITVRKEGGSFTDFSGTVTEIAFGYYEYEFTTTEVNTVGKVLIVVNKAGSLLYRGQAQVVSLDLYDTIRGGLTSLPNAAAANTGGLPTIGTGSGQVNINGSGGIDINLSQDVPATDITLKTTQNVGDCLSVARADGAGAWVISGTILTEYGPNSVQVVRTFTLNDASSPTQRA